jgi:RHS repeat-associated protein
VVGNVKPDGTVTALRSYDAYGQATDLLTDTSGSSHKYVGGLGHPTEDQSGLIYMRARFMDPAVGRFISEDPGGHGSNLFSYADNNPITGSDPDGRKTQYSGVSQQAVNVISTIMMMIAMFAGVKKAAAFAQAAWAYGAGLIDKGLDGLAVARNFEVAPDVMSAYIQYNTMVGAGALCALGAGAAIIGAYSVGMFIIATALEADMEDTSNAWPS